jgi:hypothetical protein
VTTDIRAQLEGSGLDPRYIDRLVRAQEIQAELLARDPALGVASSHVIAGDLAGLEQVEREVAAGEITPQEGLALVGSYARLQYAVRHLKHDAWLFRRLPEMWRDADPDDSDPALEALWLKAWEWNGRKPLHDGRALKAKVAMTVYRGEYSDAALGEPALPHGVSWTLDRQVALNFARGAGTRQRSREGVVLQTAVFPRDVVAFITGRGESEVVVPRDKVVYAFVQAKWNRVTPEFRQELEDVARGR